jgi:hypothetical protein
MNQLRGAPFFELWCSARRVGDHERPQRSSYALKSSARQQCIRVATYRIVRNLRQPTENSGPNRTGFSTDSPAIRGSISAMLFVSDVGDHGTRCA